jgi:hypothetical protein
MEKRRGENYYGRPYRLTRAVIDASVELLRRREGVKNAATFLSSQPVPILAALQGLSQHTCSMSLTVV